MRRLCAVGFVVASLLAAVPAAAAPCTPTETALCLNGGRFQLEVTWKDFQNRAGVGHAVALTADTGTFWFFDQANVELVVKVLDGRALNGKFWVFFGALSSVEYTLTVRDTVTGSVKQYANPSGRLASVADTAAFAATAAAPTHARMETTGSDAPAPVLAAGAALGPAPAAAAFTPCPDSRFALHLGGCRFRVEVEWRVNRQQKGLGRPVQLSDDTGYFWFFDPANVELVVKVLDGRALNGRYWVFFGALSDVEYTVVVTDLVTKSVKRYTNPKGQLASVGDTSALRGGLSVAPVRDTAHAVSADLDSAGGVVTATGADGSRFTLELPPRALLQPETITLTPVSHLAGLPLSGGLVAGVELEPDGLRLAVPATLTIEPAAAPAPNRTLTYAYGRGGGELVLHPRLLDTSAIRVPLLHFSGYGAGQGTAADATNLTRQVAGDLLAPYTQRFAYWLSLYLWEQISRDELNEHTVDIFADAFRELAEPLFAIAKESCDRADIDLAAHVGFSIARYIQIYGLADDIRLSYIAPRLFELAQEVLETCLKRAFERCKAYNDPFEALLMLYMARQLQILGVDDPNLTTFIEGGLLERCLRFELDFQSKLVDESTSGVFSLVWRLKYRARRVPLRLNLANPYASGAAWDGGCTLEPEVVALDWLEPPGFCQATIQPGKGWFDAAGAWIGVLDDPSQSAVRLLYHPGTPEQTVTAACGGGAPVAFPGASFDGIYHTLHDNEFSLYDRYMAKDWQQLRIGSGPSQNGEFFAMKSYERTIPGPGVAGRTITEETWFFLEHTPDAAMPDCP